MSLNRALKRILATCLLEFRDGDVYLPTTPGFDDSTVENYYWASSQLQPAFVLQPGSTADLSVAIRAIAAANAEYPNDTAPFAIKGGGHFGKPGANAAQGGVLIDLILFNQIDLNFDTEDKTVDVGPGQTWDNVYSALSATGYNVNGATTCQGVGVAGFLLGGGYGNKTNQYALAIDNINSINAVLLNPLGEYVEGINPNSPDQRKRNLFWALKGGGNNFAIVTNWNLPTHIQGEIYSNNVYYTPRYFPELIRAIYNFGLEQDPLANVEAVFEYWTQGTEVLCKAAVELFYDGPLPAGKFDEFLNIPHDGGKTTTTWADRQRNLPTSRQTHSHGRPNHKNDLPKRFRGRFSSVMVSGYNLNLINAAVDIARRASENMLAHTGLQIYVDIWPFIRAMFDRATDCAWPHDREHPSGPLVINFKWADPRQDTFWLGEIERVTEAIKGVALAEGLTTPTTAEYLNLSLDNVQVGAIYRNNLLRLMNLRNEFDPQRVMDNTGGFRIPPGPAA